jgi:hypothetical protein
MTKRGEDQEISSSMKAENFEFDQTAYSKVSLSARLQDVKLIGSNYSVRPDVFDIVNDLKNMDMKFSGDCDIYSFDPIDGVCVGQFSWIAEIKSGRKTCLKLKAQYFLLYSNLMECDEKHVRFFFRKVGRFATYPYFRSHFSHHTSETGVIMPPLPILQERVD